MVHLQVLPTFVGDQQRHSLTGMHSAGQVLSLATSIHPNVIVTVKCNQINLFVDHSKLLQNTLGGH